MTLGPTNLGQFDKSRTGEPYTCFAVASSNGARRNVYEFRWGHSKMAMNIDSSSATIEGLEHLQDAGKQPEPANSRQSPRFPFKRQVMVQALDKHAERVGPPIRTKGRNICLWGMCLLSPADFSTGDFIVVSFEPREGAATIEMLAEIRHTKRQRDGLIVIGCRFLEAIHAPGF